MTTETSSVLFTENRKHLAECSTYKTEFFCVAGKMALQLCLSQETQTWNIPCGQGNGVPRWARSSADSCSQRAGRTNVTDFRAKGLGQILTSATYRFIPFLVELGGGVLQPYHLKDHDFSPRVGQEHSVPWGCLSISFLWCILLLVGLYQTDRLTDGHQCFNWENLALDTNRTACFQRELTTLIYCISLG
ncbi:uncharacterized protein LOC118351329 isoform X2 [Canis lupus dingo]|uniref:uncharacterized protein LOC118351329 isoform X2 n=1 Tax=Canis lupus dingo TaxID=286419 RepID=UPI0020C51876|nr:uncharacterized protein LOC118351329 isoform X2 [Canis lupus dingo]